MSKKCGAKGSVASLKESLQLGSVSHDPHPRITVQRKEENWDQITPSNSPKAPGTKQKFGKEKGPSRGMIQKGVLHERNLCAPRFEERSREETLHQERYANGKSAFFATDRNWEHNQSVMHKT